MAAGTPRSPLPPGQAEVSVSPLLVATAVSRALTVGTQIVVGFYLTPGEFGEFVLALSTCTILSLFQSGELSRLALQERNATVRVAGQLRSFLLAGCLATTLLILSVLLLNRERFNAYFVVGLALLPFLRVMANTRVTLLSSQGASGTIAQASVFEAIARSGVAIALVVAGLGAWSLVLGEICAVLASLLMLNRYCAGPGDGWPTLSPALAKGVGQVTTSSLLNLAERELPVFAAGMVLLSADAGSFAFAQRIAAQFIVVMLPMLTLESIPRMLAVRGERGEFWSVLRAERKRLGKVCVVLLLVLGVLAPFLMYALWGERWLGAVQALPILVAATLLRVGYLFNRGVLEALGEMSVALRLALVDAGMVIVAILASLTVDGILALALALLLEGLVIYSISGYASRARAVSVPSPRDQ